MSVIVAHHGDPRPTAALLDALGDQRHAGPIEVIVVDDASPRPFPPRDDAIVHRRAVNGGFGAAINSGARIARHPALLILNSDLHITEDFVADLQRAAAPIWPAVVGPRVLDDDEADTFSARRWPTVRGYAVELVVALSRLRGRDAWHRIVGHDLRMRGGSTFRTDWVTGAAMLVPRERFIAIGGFDERFHMNSEEVDLQRRLADLGVRAWCAAGVTCRHTGGGSSGAEEEREDSVWRARLLYAEKWEGQGGVARLRVTMLAAALVNLAWQAGRRARGRDVSPMRRWRADLRRARRPADGGTLS